MKDHDTNPAGRCLRCGHPLTQASSLHSDVSPSEGDLTLCIRCGHLMAFTADLGFRDLTTEELIEAALDRRVAMTRAAIAAANAAVDSATRH